MPSMKHVIRPDCRIVIVHIFMYTEEVQVHSMKHVIRPDCHIIKVGFSGEGLKSSNAFHMQAHANHVSITLAKIS